MITIQGAITLRTPFHTSAGHQGLRLTAEGKLSSNSQDGLAVISTTTMPMSSRGRFYGYMPIVPSTSVIAGMRRSAASRLRQALLSDGKKIPVSAFHALTHGQPASVQLGSTITLEQFNASRQDLFFGLFGGASLRNSAQFIQSDLLPVIDASLEASMVPQRFADLAPAGHGHVVEPKHLLAYRVMRKVDDLRRGRDALNAVDVELETLEPDAKTEAAAAYQIVTPGTNFFFRCQLKDSTTAEQRGLLLLALMDWINKGQIGAREHLGWGQFTAHRFRYIDQSQSQRHDLFDTAEDEDGLLGTTTTESFNKLVEPTVAMLDMMSQSPEKARNQLLTLLQGRG